MRILLLCIVVISLFMTPDANTNSSRDLLLTLRNKAVPLNHRVRQVVSQLWLATSATRITAAVYWQLAV